MSDITPPIDFDTYRSHAHKTLRVHTEGVLEGVQKRTSLSIATVAALFHDFGKLSPNFQPKLDGITVAGYSSHAYLSAHAFLCFCHANRLLAKEMLGDINKAALFSVVSLIAHHHGSLTDFREILSIGEREELEKFLLTRPEIPASDFLHLWHSHQNFDILGGQFAPLMKGCSLLPDKVREQITDRLGFFQETQFAFAALLESDKRDAGDNKWFRRDEQLGWAKANFHPLLTQALPPNDKSELNQTRTQIRNEAVSNLDTLVSQGQRVFSLTAPTGSGKTFTLLALADAIRRYHPNHAVCYGLPFLSITEQVEDICRDYIFKTNPEFVTRIDSRSLDKQLEAIVEASENDPDKSTELLNRSFSLDTFDAAFSITTFVQIFETLLSNRGSLLLRLPNFGKCIFLLDEIQALPPRLYVFLTAYLQAFCERFDSFVVLSTATMPNLALPQNCSKTVALLFHTYQEPQELVDFNRYYSLAIFNRYKIQCLDTENELFALPDLAKPLRATDEASLVILNTVDDTLGLYHLLCPNGPCADVRLINTRFTLDDRLATIKYCKRRLERGERIILISTSLIEAGVDIDFPSVYRDLCPLPNLIQSAGRCNRNGRRGVAAGKVWLFTLHGDKGKPSAERIYREPADRRMLDFTRSRIKGTISENDLIGIQREHFQQINQNLVISDHPLKVNGDKYVRANIAEHIGLADFKVVGSFRLINEQDFGIEYRYYVPVDDNDTLWEQLAYLVAEGAAVRSAAKGKLSFAEGKKQQIRIDTHLRRMSGRLVTVRLYQPDDAPPAIRQNGEVKEVCGLRKLLLPGEYYSLETGLRTDSPGFIIL